MSEPLPAEGAAWMRELRAILPPDAFCTGEAAAPYAVDGVAPAAVAAPNTPEGVAAVLRVAHRYRLAVCPVGAGRYLGYGLPPRRYDLAL
ncbi:MAG: hypothetical protein QHJ73_03740, partial [Armatimonadota bacterium]|nr:hypothetical protein [Armatimonadota bacterium]